MAEEATPVVDPPAAEKPPKPKSRARATSRSVMPATPETETGVRVILQRVQVVEVPPATDLKALGKALGLKGQAETFEAWREVAQHGGKDKESAIELHTGKAGEPDSKQGVFRAPPLSGWRGAVVMLAPPAPLVQKTRID